MKEKKSSMDRNRGSGSSVLNQTGMTYGDIRMGGAGRQRDYIEGEIWEEGEEKTWRSEKR